MPEQATFVTLDNIVNGWRQRVLFFIDTSAWGKLWDVADLLLNIALCVVYIIPDAIPTASRLLEFVLAGTALSQYIVRYVAINANQRVFEHAVALVAFGAPMVAYIVGAHSAAVRASYMGAGVAAVFYPARFLRLHYAMQRAVALGASIPRLRLTLIRQEVISLCSDIVVVILAFACFVHSGINWYSQSHGLPHRKFTFLDAIYSIVMSGAGQDGTTPPSTFNQVISMVVLALIALAVPSRVSRLVDLAINTSAYSKTVALPAATRHALLCGNIEVESVRQFLQEFFNSDHGANIFKATLVILHHEEPTMEMKSLLRSPAYANRVFYVKGRATSLKSLKRTRVDLASCVYILTRKTSDVVGVEEDAETVLIALALSAFSSPLAGCTGDDPQCRAPPFQVYAQTVLPDSVAHLAYLQTTRIVCVDEMRLGIMAQNCATPGFAALAFLLSTSMTDRDVWDYSGIFTEHIATSAEDEWVKSYIHGISQEIYQVHVPKSLIGMSFFKAARYFYRCHGLLVFSVGSYTAGPSRAAPPGPRGPWHPVGKADGGCYEVCLAPRRYMLQQYDILFAISTDVQSVLDAVLVAERVSITSTHIKRSRRLERADRTPPPPAATAAAAAAPVQRESPRRVIAQAPAARARGQNYLSDSDSSYFSAAVLEAGGGGGAAAGRAGAARGPRRGDGVPAALAGHIVVCDSSSGFPRSAALLVRALKAAFDSAELPVVILSPGTPGCQYQLDALGHVYHVRGTPLSLADLRRANIQAAQRAIVLGGTPRRAGDAGDSPAILTNMNIQQLCGPEFYVTTELGDMESIRYLDHTQLLGSPLLKRTFMGGHIFAPSLLDTSLCQSYFSSHVLDVLRQLTFSRPPATAADAAPADAGAACRPGRLSLLFVPDRFIGQRYDTLALTLMKQHMAVPLGLYRVVGARGQNFAVVMCNPLPATPLVASDAVYVLGPALANWMHFSETLQLAAAAAAIAGRRESAAESPPATGSSGQTTTNTSESRHTVYSHNISITSKLGHASDGGSDDDRSAEADVSDNDARDHAATRRRPEDMV